ncbi:hypothetical protein [Umezawaea beigongshangensis]|uniref:hypothetical protein n=1 Tax=Umezawaea beigongshangensis TaxID=2780383 RepID=UPI0018F20153|nr:hypothetical protein [Umezawaea beigongshangensis]
MSALVERLEIAARVLGEHPGAPEVAFVRVDHSASFGPPVSMQLRTLGCPVRAVATWALALGTSVQISELSSGWKLTATARVDGDDVEVWDCCGLAEIVRLIPALELSLPGWTLPVLISPQALLDALDAAEAVA